MQRFRPNLTDFASLLLELAIDYILLQPCPKPDEGCSVPGGDGPPVWAQAGGYPQRRVAPARLSGHQSEWQGACDHRLR